MACIAKTVETDDARDFVTFHLDERAHFSDGKPVTSEDVLFSWELLRDHGRPNHRQYYSKVARAEALDRLTVRFDLTGANDRELPLILGLLPVLAEACGRSRDLRRDLTDAADRLGPLPDHGGQARRQHHLHARSRLLGA